MAPSGSPDRQPSWSASTSCQGIICTCVAAAARAGSFRRGIAPRRGLGSDDDRQIFEALSIDERLRREHLVERVVPFAEIPEAMSAAWGGHVGGKIVVEVG